MSSRGYRKMIESYEVKFDTLIKVFIKQLVDTARSSVTTFESHLLNLVTRLDYNGFSVGPVLTILEQIFDQKNMMFLEKSFFWM